MSSTPAKKRRLNDTSDPAVGFVGIHSASDTEYQWPWYGRLVGAYFASHPEIQRATIRIANPNHPATKSLPAFLGTHRRVVQFRQQPRGMVQVLATLDEATYSGGTMGADHPIAWCQTVGGGRSWYTAMGHTADSFREPLFQLHLLGGSKAPRALPGTAGLSLRPFQSETAKDPHHDQ